MKIKHDDILIDENNPFANCKLRREKYAGVLTNIVATYAEGFVLAINNEWGTGKTTFGKMWQQHLKNNQFLTLYFNAWENDFDNNPLVALMAELNTLTKNETEQIFKSLIKKGAVLTKNVLPAIAKAIASKYIDTQMIQEAIENTTKAATEILDDEIKEYASKKKGLEDFKNELSEFVSKTKGDKPIVFIIDELDRCRPDYAVEVLEQIKHFFSVKGIVFVLSIDKVQLGNAVRGFYGSDRINADEYLRRFIDLEYTMPEPDTKVFCEYLYDYFEFYIFLESDQRVKFQELREDKNLLIAVATKMFKHVNASLRQQEKVFSHTRIILNSFKPNNYIFPSLLMVLVIIRMLHEDLYSRIRKRKLTLDELIEEFAKIVPPEEGKYSTKYFTQIEANLIWMYNNSDQVNKIELVETDQNGKNSLTIKSKYSEEQNLKHYLLNYMRTGETSLEYLTDKIELTEMISL
jgi:hypothetical protein